MTICASSCRIHPISSASSLQQSNWPEETYPQLLCAAVVDVVRLGRMTALQKPDGGVRGIVVGDVLRRLVGRTMAQQLMPEVERFTAPFQYALKTRAGTE